MTKRQQLLQKRNEKIAALYLDGASLDEAGAPFGIKRQMVRRIITRLGIVQRFYLTKKRKLTAEEKLRKREIKFWSQAALTADIDRCWEWKGNVSIAGHARACWNGRMRYARRVAWQISSGKEPINYILNRCNNSICVNPHHLLEGSGKQKNKRKYLTGEK